MLLGSRELVSFGLAHLDFHTLPAEWLFKWRTGWFLGYIPLCLAGTAQAQKRGSLLTKEIEAWVQFHLKAQNPGVPLGTSAVG